MLASGLPTRLVISCTHPSHATGEAAWASIPVCDTDRRPIAETVAHRARAAFGAPVTMASAVKFEKSRVITFGSLSEREQDKYMEFLVENNVQVRPRVAAVGGPKLPCMTMHPIPPVLQGEGRVVRRKHPPVHCCPGRGPGRRGAHAGPPESQRRPPAATHEQRVAAIQNEQGPCTAYPGQHCRGGHDIQLLCLPQVLVRVCV